MKFTWLLCYSISMFLTGAILVLCAFQAAMSIEKPMYWLLAAISFITIFALYMLVSTIK